MVKLKTGPDGPPAKFKYGLALADESKLKIDNCDKAVALLQRLVDIKGDHESVARLREIILESRELLAELKGGSGG